MFDLGRGSARRGPAECEREVGAYALPRRERRTERFATGALLDALLGVGLLADLSAAASALGGIRRVAHVAQRPSRSALSSLVISSGPWIVSSQ